MGSFDFDSLTEVELRARKTVKWNWYKPDVLPLWVAEMDFPTAPAVMDAIREAVQTENFGYPAFGDPELGQVTAEWCASRYGWSVNPGFIHDVPDVLDGLRLGIEEFTVPGSPVILPTPAYPPFYDVIRLSGRQAIEIPLVEVDGVSTLDFQRIDEAFSAGAGSIILCNPHNPAGRAFTQQELTTLSTIVERHGKRVLADEIHAPLVFGRKHIPYASVSAAAAQHTITLTAASKAWNLAGLKCAQIILTNEEDEKTWSELSLVQTMGASTIGIAASIAAYRHGGPWLDEAMAYLEGNRALLKERLERDLPGARLIFPEATYMAWIDFSGLHLPQAPYNHFLDAAHVALKEGAEFGPGYEGFARINFATTRKILVQALDAMVQAVPATTA
ncbi:MalY/PatB family protein [Arthrobacter cavernae]|uniref:cysteine-S-conjugate beta-lyase n=1 Tax=Arthrobacter cavernae TaxID=2817681 RepID=A0A939HL15_9MICC|nr:MalY/PatB family protein [Arthrobacter cavernae]MBO1269315.1 pyridoxal phosphate-dependent aminotransferase [Arthrobacter cavernae]